MNSVMPRLIAAAIKTFGLSLGGRTVLTEAATGNYVVTPVIAALAGAEVFAFTRASRFGSIDEVKRQTEELIAAVRPHLPVRVITSLGDAPMDRLDVLTNTGFLRPIGSMLVDRLPRSCVIPLMWETWEFRSNELDMDACWRRGIKVYGTNEDDPRLRTKDYLGFIVLKRLLAESRTPFSTRVLLLGCEEFYLPVQHLLLKIGYECVVATVRDTFNSSDFDALVLLEHKEPTELVGSPTALIPAKMFRPDQMVIHVCGQADFSELVCARYPETVAPFGFMSITTDYADPKALIDLHTAGLSVAEGMLEANRLRLSGREYKEFVERHYPAQAFSDQRYW